MLKSKKHRMPTIAIRTKYKSNINDVPMLMLSNIYETRNNKDADTNSVYHLYLKISYLLRT